MLGWVVVALFLAIIVLGLVRYSQTMHERCSCHLIAPSARKLGAHCLHCHHTRNCACAKRAV